MIYHYDGPGAALAYSEEEAGAKWQRDIPGIDGSLCATQEAGGEVILQLHNLKGDIVAQAKDSASAESLLSTHNSTEFDVPSEAEGPLPKYAFLGAGGLSSERASGVIVEGGTSYVPQTGRTLQSVVLPPGLPEGSGPLVSYSLQEASWNITDTIDAGEAAVGREAQLEAEARRKVEEHENELAKTRHEGYEEGYGAGYGAGLAVASESQVTVGVEAEESEEESSPTAGIARVRRCHKRRLIVRCYQETTTPFERTRSRVNCNLYRGETLFGWVSGKLLRDVVDSVSEAGIAGFDVVTCFGELWEFGGSISDACSKPIEDVLGPHTVS